jgi:hypothetical protein
MSMFFSRVNDAVIRLRAESITAALLTILISSVSMMTLPHAHAATSPINVIAQPPFTGSYGKLKVVGVVKNDGTVPVEVMLGLHVVAKSSTSPVTLQEPTYGRIIYPATISPFKFTIEPGWSVSGGPVILSAKQILVPHYTFLTLSYSNIPVGSDGALVGTAKNVSPLNLHNVTILADVHNASGVQIDSVKSQLFPLIKPGQSVSFTAVPDPTIKSHIAYFSCADISIGNNPALNTLGIGNGQIIAYQMNGVVQISDLRYDNATDSLVFGIKHYNPAGGPFSLKMSETSKNPVSVIMDGKLYSEASVKMDGKTVSVNFIVPPADHEVQIKGIRNIT